MSQISKLQALQARLPVANSRVARGHQEAQQIQLQAALGPGTLGTPGPQPGPGASAGIAQAAGAQQAAALAAPVLASAGTTGAQATQLGQTALAEQGSIAQSTLAASARGIETRGLLGQERLANLDEATRNQIHGERLAFSEAEAGRALMNERRLAEYAAVRSRSIEEFKDWRQKATQLHDRKIATLRQASRRVQQDLELEYQKKKQDSDQARIQELRDQELALKKAEEKALAEKKGNEAIWTGIWTGVGALVGGIATGGTGAGAGAALGGAFGSATAKPGGEQVGRDKKQLGKIGVKV